jgi:hypothetical protein
MDYTDRVLKKLQDLKPGSRVRMENLREPDKFIEAVKCLFDEGYISCEDYIFSPDYSVLKKIDHSLYEPPKNINKGFYA